MEERRRGREGREGGERSTGREEEGRREGKTRAGREGRGGQGGSERKAGKELCETINCTLSHVTSCYIMFHHLLLDMLLHVLSVLLALFEFLHHLREKALKLL